MAPKVRDMRDRFWEKVDKSGDCWLWLGYINVTGYGEFRPRTGVNSRAHRVAFELMKGPIPEGLVLHHECRNKACVNPSHLTPMTDGDNLKQDRTGAEINREKTHCPKGHEYTAENTYVRARGARDCIECRRIYDRERRVRNVKS